MSKIDQTKLTPQILEKINEVNDEAGYRTHLEVAEMIRIICEVVEANYNVIPMNLEEIVLVDNLFCFVKSRKSHINNNKCSACGIVANTWAFSESHHAII
jgi:hypothetical protein